MAIAVALIVVKAQREPSVPLVGVVQLIPHPSLDSMREGFLEALAAEGFHDGKEIVVRYSNAQGDTNTANQIVRQFVNDQAKIIFAITTPCAQAAAEAGKKLSVIFGAVTDCVSARLCQSLEKPGGMVTGSSDVWPYERSFEALKELKPQTRRIGLVYNPGEANSVAALELIKPMLARLGITLETAPISSTTEVLAAARSLVGRGINAFYVGADNTAIAAVDSLIKVAEEARIPVLAGEDESVRRGATLALAVDFHELGMANGRQAARILRAGGCPSRSRRRRGWC